MSFRSRVTKLASETAVYGVSSVVGRLITFLLVPFYTQFFAPDVYGVVILLYTAFVFLNILYTYGMESAYLKYASGSEGRDRKEDVFSIAIWSLLATSVSISVIILLLRGPMLEVIGVDTRWIHLLYYAVAILTLDTLAVVPFAELRLANRPVTFAGIKIANILTNVGLNVFLIVGLRWGIESIFIANLASSALSLVLLAPLLLKNLRLRFGSAFWGEMMRFGLPFLPGGLGYALTDRVNLFFLAQMDRENVIRLYGDSIDVSALAARAQEAATAVGQAAGSAATDAVFGQYVAGVFGTVWKLGIFMMLLVQMFRFAWQPFFLQHADDEDAKPLFSRVFTLFTATSLFVLLAVSLFAEELVAIPLPGGRTLIEGSYWLGLSIVPIALLAYFFQGWYYNFSAGAYIRKKTIYFVHCTLAGGLVAVVLNALFVPAYGMLAAAWATAAAYGVMALMLGVIMYRFYPMPYEWGRVTTLLALAGSLFAIWYLVEGADNLAAEFGLLAAYVAGLFGARVIRVGAVRSLLSRSP
ncbi:MAG: polysaccharide biosynthesis C-terminal domain-containing protein [Rhodothermia bacterium]|nr:polysaccharide biosynthesis C-terminal domain-containing protein [Rhodothermia bacterium]